MYQLVESIRIEKQQLHHIEYHNQRLNRSGKALWYWENWVDLKELITLPEWLTNERYKCRVVTNGISFNVTFEQYIQRKIQTLKVVHFNTIDYSHKSTNRELLNEAFQQRENCDDIIIVKNGYITDASAANILLFDGANWITPNTPLLKGTQREFLLLNGKIIEKTVSIEDMAKYTQIKLVNALIPFEYADIIEINDGVVF
jgi:4-amino-4-deoxychorismate lyase